MLLKLSDPNLSLHPVTDADSSVLCEIYASTRETEMNYVPGWSNEQKDAFLRQQFAAQHAYYRQHYKNAFFYLIRHNSNVAGRIYVSPDFMDGSIRIVDITLLPAYRGKGHGESILRDIMSYAKAEKKSITIHVESFNPAMRLYERLGFRLKDRKNEVYHLLEWNGEA